MLKFARKTPQGDGPSIAFAESGKEVYRIAEKPDGWQVETWQEGFVISFRHETLDEAETAAQGLYLLDKARRALPLIWTWEEIAEAAKGEKRAEKIAGSKPCPYRACICKGSKS